MCLNPIWIKNKGYYRLGGMPYVECPCGHCEECADTRAIDYFVRTWALYRSLPENWSVWFCTFTFNEENVPRSRVMARQHSELTGYYITQIGETRCFDHRILHRFTKSYRQYYRRDLGLEPPHMLITCEFGDKFGRPHYHAIVFLPRQMTWQTFKAEIERFWHYGFTKNVSLARVDGLEHERSVENSIKYVVKYVTKGNGYSMPYYFNHGDRVFLGDVPPEYYTPRVFTTNHFGAALEKVLTKQNYEDNKITFQVHGKWKEFNLPSYFRRRYYTSTKVIKVEKYYKNTYWHRDKLCKRITSETEYSNDYEVLRRKLLDKRCRIEHGQCVGDNLRISQSDWIKYRMLDYNANKERRYVYKEVPLNYDPLNSDGLTLEHIFGDKPLQFFKYFISLSPNESTFINYEHEKVTKAGSLFCRHFDFYDYLCKTYGVGVLDVINRMECSIANRRFQEIERRKIKKVGERVAREHFYFEHNVSKSV